MPWRLLRRLEEIQAHQQEAFDQCEEHLARIEEFQGQLERRLDSIGVVEGRLDVLEQSSASRLDQAEETLRRLQSLLEELKSKKLTALELRQDEVESGVGTHGREIGRIRDVVFPAAESRWDALFERLFFEVEEVASLVERSLAGEALPVPAETPKERDLNQALCEVQQELMESLRGSEDEIAHRMEANLPLLKDRAPILDLGCGRGEWLGLLRERGIRAEGIESDTALVASARRRGFSLRSGDVLAELEKIEDESFGAVTAFHLLEHISPNRVLSLLKEVWRVLKPGGRFMIECPDPENLRVGASLFWLDPTHLRPLHLKTLELYSRSSGFVVLETGRRHPFPPEQQFAQGASQGDEALGRLEARLDALLNGPRDFYLLLGRES